MKTLILKPSSLGDVVQALPVLRLLKIHNPANEVYWWISTDLAELLQGDSDLSGIFLFDRRHWLLPRGWIGLLRGIQRMRAHRFDWVIDLQGLARSSLIAWLAKGQLTVGVEDWREGAPGFYDVAVRRPSPTSHAVDWYLEIPRLLGVPVHSNFTWLPARPEAEQRLRNRWMTAGERWIIINPGARWLNKRWPAESYGEVVRQLTQSCPELRFAILGSASDASLGAAIARVDHVRCLDLTGKTSLPEVIEWIRLAELVVTNDTGPMHIAAALGKPVVALFGPTDPRRTGPYGQVRHALSMALPCAPCLSARCRHDKPMECLRGITPASVCSAIQARLALE